MLQTTTLTPLFALLPLLHICSAYIAVGGGVRVGVGVWINGKGGATTSSSEYTALQAWKAALTEDPTGVLSSWVGPDVCSYRGVFCSDPPAAAAGDVTGGGGRVVAAIDLNGAALRGTLVKDLSLLSHLSVLHLNSNRLSGAVPDSFKDFAFLSELDLSNNVLSGPFPAAALLIPNLVYFDIRFNAFSGAVPAELFTKELDAIFLNNNQFDGEIPMTIWASPASVITLANNKFSGTVPASFGYMGSGIREVLFLNNSLTGCIPDGVGYVPGIEVLDLSFNELTGRVPGSLACLAEIEVLNIGHNRLSGELPDLCELRSLANLSVAFNFFSGFGQDCVRRFVRNVLGFDFSGNCIPGREMQRPPPECMGGGAPGDGLSCLGVPSTRPVACAGSANALPGMMPYALGGTLP